MPPAVVVATEADASWRRRRVAVWEKREEASCDFLCRWVSRAVQPFQHVLQPRCAEFSGRLTLSYTCAGALGARGGLAGGRAEPDGRERFCRGSAGRLSPHTAARPPKMLHAPSASVRVARASRASRKKEAARMAAGEHKK